MASHDFCHPAYSPPVTESTIDSFIFLNFPPRFVPGVSSPIAWTLSLNGTISLKLIQGPTSKAIAISTIAHFIENKGTFYWTPSISIAPGENYFLQIVSDDDEELFVYSPRFSIADYIVRRKELDASFASSAISVATSRTVTTATAPAITTKSSTSSSQFFTSQTSSSLRTSTQTISTQTSSAQTTSTRTGSKLQTSTQTSATLQSLTYTSSTRATTSATSSATGGATSAGLSAGAAAGIGVGATFGGLIIIAAIVFFIFRFRRRQRRQPPDTSHPSVPELGIEKSQAPELEAEKLPEKDTKLYPQSPQMAEMGAPLSPIEYNELESRRRAAELEGRSNLPTELQANPRAELEARRVAAHQIYEIGPTS